MRTITYPPGLFGTATHLKRLYDADSRQSVLMRGLFARYFVNMNLTGTLVPGVTGLLPNSIEQLYEHDLPSCASRHAS